MIKKDFIYINNFYQGKRASVYSYDPDFEVEVTVDGTINDNFDLDRGWPFGKNAMRSREGAELHPLFSPFMILRKMCINPTGSSYCSLLNNILS